MPFDFRSNLDGVTIGCASTKKSPYMRDFPGTSALRADSLTYSFQTAVIDIDTNTVLTAAQFSFTLEKGKEPVINQPRFLSDLSKIHEVLKIAQKVQGKVIEINNKNVTLNAMQYYGPAGAPFTNMPEFVK
jgi:hypothetical protein